MVPSFPVPCPPPDLERAPTRSLDSEAKALAVSMRQTHMSGDDLRPEADKLSPAERSALETALAKARRIVADRGTELFPLFQDFDKGHTYHITFQQFSRALKQFAMTPDSDLGLKALLA